MFRHVKPGEPFRPQANLTNALIDSLDRSSETSGPSTTGRRRSPSRVLIENATGATLDRWSTVPLSTPISLSPTVALPNRVDDAEFVFRVESLSSELIDSGAVAVLQEPILANRTGEAIADGLTWARLYKTSDNGEYLVRASNRYAHVTPGATSPGPQVPRVGSYGPMEILSAVPTSVGEFFGLVRVDNWRRPTRFFSGGAKNGEAVGSGNSIPIAAVVDANFGPIATVVDKYHLTPFVTGWYSFVCRVTIGIGDTAGGGTWYLYVTDGIDTTNNHFAHRPVYSSGPSVAQYATGYLTLQSAGIAYFGFAGPIYAVVNKVNAGMFGVAFSIVDVSFSLEWVHTQPAATGPQA